MPITPNPSAFNINLPQPTGYLAGALLGQQNAMQQRQQQLLEEQFQQEQLDRILSNQRKTLENQQAQADEEMWKQEERKLKGGEFRDKNSLIESGMNRALLEAEAGAKTSEAKLKRSDADFDQRFNLLQELDEGFATGEIYHNYDKYREKMRKVGITPPQYPDLAMQEKVRAASKRALDNRTLQRQSRLSEIQHGQKLAEIAATGAQTRETEKQKYGHDLEKQHNAFLYDSALLELKGKIEKEVAEIKARGDADPKSLMQVVTKNLIETAREKGWSKEETAARAVQLTVAMTTTGTVDRWSLPGGAGTQARQTSPEETAYTAGKTAFGSPSGTSSGTPKISQQIQTKLKSLDSAGIKFKLVPQGQGGYRFAFVDDAGKEITPSAELKERAQRIWNGQRSDGQSGLW